MESARTQKGPKKMSHPHHVVPKHESGYTDEAAEECHDLIDRAEEDAHVSLLSCFRGSTKFVVDDIDNCLQLHEPGSMYSTTDKPEHVHRMKGSLESTGGEGGGGGSSATKKMQETGKNVSSTIGEKVGQVKEKMGMKK
jgi:hypothetical protein